MTSKHSDSISDPSTKQQTPDVGWKFDNSYARLGDRFCSCVMPQAFHTPKLYLLNENLAADLGLSVSILSAQQLGELFTGKMLPDGASPIAQAYAGHQYGGFTILGDGRAILLGEHITPSGARVDIQFKGSGQTPFSRRGDGRAALGPMLREYIISEAMYHLGIPTTRSLAVSTTGEPVYRERPLRGAVLTRVASSHIRVGTFQFFAATRDLSSLRAIADYTIDRHFPELSETYDRYLQLLREVALRQAKLVAMWMGVGFIHGVMNTDNVLISGETIDYGPCAFMNTYDPETVFSSIDHNGRYAYGNQLAIAQWNLVRFAEALIPLFDSDEQTAVEMAKLAVSEFPGIFETSYLETMVKKIGISLAKDGDAALLTDLLRIIQRLNLDFTNTFRDLADSPRSNPALGADEEFKSWWERWECRLKFDGNSPLTVKDQMNLVNPCYIARNHLVEDALDAAENHEDLEPFNRLLSAISNPYKSSESLSDLTIPPQENERCYRTFCGT